MVGGLEAEVTDAHGGDDRGFARVGAGNGKALGDAIATCEVYGADVGTGGDEEVYEVVEAFKVVAGFED